MTILVTGGAGFIGSNFVIDWLNQHDELIINIDKLTYAGNLNNLSSLERNENHVFVAGDIGDATLLKNLLGRYKPRAVINFAAESHVDRSIHGPEDFIQTNIIGTFRLLECVKRYWQSLSIDEQSGFRFLHVSTDEVYGSLPADASIFRNTSLRTEQPVHCKQASSDHLVRLSSHLRATRALPTVQTTMDLTNFEKLIPLVIHNTRAKRFQFMAMDCRYVIGYMSAITAVPFAPYSSVVSAARSTILVA